jgi:hypothetical protein
LIRLAGPDKVSRCRFSIRAVLGRLDFKAACPNGQDPTSLWPFVGEFIAFACFPVLWSGKFGQVAW